MAAPGGADSSVTAEQLKVRYVGTGDADTSPYEFLTNQHRDTYASYVGHYDQLSYMAVALNESIGRTRLNCLDSIIQPCGPPPPSRKKKLTTTTKNK